MTNFFKSIAISFLLLALHGQADDVISQDDTINQDNVINQDNEQDFSPPEFKSLGEEKVWKINNQKDIDAKYDALRRKIVDSKFGSDVIITNNDTAESIEKKYANAEMLYDSYVKQLNNLRTEYLNWFKRCDAQGCAVTGVCISGTNISQAQGLVTLQMNSGVEKYIDRLICGESTIQGKEVIFFELAKTWGKNTLRSATNSCASIHVFNLDAGDIITLEQYKQYLKTGFDEMDELNALYKQQTKENAKISKDANSDIKKRQATLKSKY